MGTVQLKLCCSVCWEIHGIAGLKSEFCNTGFDFAGGCGAAFQLRVGIAPHPGFSDVRTLFFPS